MAVFKTHPYGEITEYACLDLAGADPAKYVVSCVSDRVGSTSPVGRQPVPNCKLTGYIFGVGLTRKCPAKFS